MLHFSLLMQCIFLYIIIIIVFFSQVRKIFVNWIKNFESVSYWFLCKSLDDGDFQIVNVKIIGHIWTTIDDVVRQSLMKSRLGWENFFYREIMEVIFSFFGYFHKPRCMPIGNVHSMSAIFTFSCFFLLNVHFWMNVRFSTIKLH